MRKKEQYKVGDKVYHVTSKKWAVVLVANGDLYTIRHSSYNWCVRHKFLFRKKPKVNYKVVNGELVVA